jgi:hypothetical protein
MLHRNDLFDVWRTLNPETKRYTFKRGKSKSSIDYILCSNVVSSKVFGTQINHFPFSDHDVVITKLKTQDINRSPGMWIMNLETIKSEQFRHAFKIWWNNWKIEKNKYSDIWEWWDLTKNKIKLLTIEISRSLNCKQNKKEIDRIERQLDKLKLIAKETDEISVQIKQLEGLIKNYYNKKKQKQRKLDLVLNGRKEGKNQRDISLTFKKSGAKKSYGIGLKRQTVNISTTLTR